MGLDAANRGVQFQDMDPQRIWTAEDLAFLGATIMRSLTAYTYSPDPVEASRLIADAATDTGTAVDGGRAWSFTLRNDLTWQDGSSVTCADFAYGASRSFATDIIFDGPLYAIAYLDIPTDENGQPDYPGPYKATAQQQALFDQAVSCDGDTITFRLNMPVADFNETVTLGFGAVPNPIDHPGVDDGEDYTLHPWSDGPYMISESQPGVGGHMTLDRNPYWNPASDPVRPAYIDTWLVEFGLDPHILDQRLMASTGDDRFALQYANSNAGIDSNDLAAIFSDAHTPLPDFAGRAFSDYDQIVRYMWIATDKVANPLIRQAMAVALDRQALREVYGGELYADYADGVLKPNIGMDYAPTHLWDGLLGQVVPPAGDPEFARQLIAQSGEQPPTIAYDYVPGPVSDQVAGIVQDSLQGAGLTVKPTPFNSYCGLACSDEMGGAGWGADWPNASTVIAPLFTPDGGFDLSRVGSDNYPEFESAVADALATFDRGAQAAKWQALNTQAAHDAFVIPTFFSLQQTIAGDAIGNLYRWPVYSSWPYAQLYVNQ